MLQSKQLLISIALVYQVSFLCLIRATDTTTAVLSGSADPNPLTQDQKHNYCLRNVTYYEDVVVNKTRQVLVKPRGNFLSNIFRKAKYETQQYVDTEQVMRTRLVNECCAGYAMADNKTCLPVCQSGCPSNAYCRAPNKCQCRRGYDVVRSNLTETYHCNPSCSSGCPYGGRCMAPELCKCADGYRALAGTCVPACSTGEVGCEESTEPTLDESTDATQSFASDTTDIYMDVEARSSNEGLSAVADDAADEDSVLFPSTYEEANCTLQPCIGDAKCKLVGSCACADGYTMYQPAPVNDIEVGAICASVIDQSELLHDESKSKTFFIIVGVVVMICVMALLALKLWRHQHGSLDVEGKSDMCCKYDKNSASSGSGHGVTI